MQITNERHIIILSTGAFLLFLPLIAMQFTSEVNWTLGDFVAASVLLMGAGLACEFVIRNISKKNVRFALLLAIFAISLLVWAELAAGIFDSPFSGS